MTIIFCINIISRTSFKESLCVTVVCLMSRASLPRYIRMFFLLENVYSMKSQSFNQQLSIAIFADDGRTDERIDQ